MNLDPLISADPSFDTQDLIGNVMEGVRRGNKIWAYPLTILPTALRYDSSQFTKAGAALPASRWTIDSFVDALKALGTVQNTPPFASYEGDGLHLLALIAAYGGVPLDYRTSPTTINFTDPDTVTAIRQVLDLAKHNHIKYSSLGVLDFNRSKWDGITPIFPETLDMVIFNRGRQDGVYRYVLYPHGSKYNSVQYQIGTAYISAHAQNPQACYRWISTLAQHPELFYAIPVRHIQLNNPALTSAVSPEIITLYTEFDKLLKAPNTLVFSAFDPDMAAPSTFLTRYWLYKAFDTYVLQDGDLDTALKDAETKAKQFQTCVATLPSVPLNTLDTQSQQALSNCAVKVDPALKSLFTP